MKILATLNKQFKDFILTDIVETKKEYKCYVLTTIAIACKSKNGNNRMIVIRPKDLDSYESEFFTREHLTGNATFKEVMKDIKSGLIDEKMTYKDLFNYLSKEFNNLIVI